ncbi:unnamed protein product [Rhodiola kirilowii]
MATELEELLEFLSSPSPQVKKAAVDIVQGLTGSDEGIKSLASYSGVMLPALSRLVGDKKEFAEPAAEALVNLSQNSNLVTKMVEGGMVKGAMELLYKQGCSITKLLVMLLVNLTQSEAGIASLLQVEDEKMQGLYVMKLVRVAIAARSLMIMIDDCIKRYIPRRYRSVSDPFEHVGSILVNISQKDVGRKILLDPSAVYSSKYLDNLILQVQCERKEYGPPIYCCRVAGTIRNCCFEAESQLQNLLLTSEFLWPALLLPVAGNKVYSEQETSKMPLELASALSIEREAEDDPEIRIQTLEAIYMILLQEAGRRAFWSVNGPHILKIGYEDEHDPKVMEAYERVGSLLVHGNDAEEDPSLEPSK